MPSDGAEYTDEGKQAVALKFVKEALNGENPHADKSSSYDDPAWVEAMADHVAYRTYKLDDEEEISLREARRLIDELAFQGELQRITDDMWKDDKVTLP